MMTILRTLTAAIASLCIVSCMPARYINSGECTDSVSYKGSPLFAERWELPTHHRFPDGVFDQNISQRLDLALEDAMRHTKAAHMTAGVATPEAIWSGALSRNGVVPPRRFYWASVGKMFTAVVMMQLIEEGKIVLDDPVSRWVPGLPNGALMTVDHLLSHTSGLFSANEDPELRNARRYFPPEESIRISAANGAMFCPGEAWRYSNTGYTVLGMIIEAVDRRPYHEAVNQRIAARLKLSTLRALAPQETPSDLAPLTPADGSHPLFSYSWPFAAGAVIGTAEDMLRFWHATLTAKLLTDEKTSLLFEHLYPMFDKGTYYGRGVMLYKLPVEKGTGEVWIGHSGGTPGAKAVVAYSHTQRAFVAVALSGDGSAEASANLILSKLAEPRPK